MRDLFDRMYEDKGPLGKWAQVAEGYFAFPKLEGSISNRMKFKGKEVITWSVNDYLGLANLPEIRKADADALPILKNETEVLKNLRIELKKVKKKLQQYELNEVGKQQQKFIE